MGEEDVLLLLYIASSEEEEGGDSSETARLRAVLRRNRRQSVGTIDLDIFDYSTRTFTCTAIPSLNPFSS